MTRATRRLAAHLPCFGLQALARHDAGLRAHPLALEGEGEMRGRVAEASRAARAQGVAEGQTLAQARGACPELRVVTASGGALADARRAAHDALLMVSPRVEWSGGGTFCAEATGLAPLFGSERALLAHACGALDDAGFVARAACASTRLAATVAARARPGTCIVPDGEEASFLAPLPLDALPLREDALRRFGLLGVRTIGQFARLPSDGLADRFGREVARWQRLVRGEDPPLAALPLRDAAQVTHELDAPVDGLEAVTFLLKTCCEDLGEQLARRGTLASRVELALALDHPPGGLDRRVMEPSLPAGSSGTLLSLCRLELEQRRLAAPLVALSLSVLEETPAQGRHAEMFGESFDAEALAAALDRVRALVGPEDVVAPAPRDAHRREARRAWEPFRIPVKRGSGDGAAACAVSEAERLLERALPVDVALSSGRGTLHPCAAAREALGLRDRIEIVRAVGPVRLMGEWWDGGADVDRDEWLLVGSDGSACRACCDRRTGAWTLLGVID